MVGKTKQATVEQQHRMETIKEFCGCLPCLLEGFHDSHCEVHHVLDCGRRIGHDATYGNCPWHHQGHAWQDKRPGEMKEMIGPSMAMHRADYKTRYGSEQRLLSTQNYMLRLFGQHPWHSFNVRIEVAECVRSYWEQYPELAAA